MPGPHFTVIIPTYNRAHVLSRAIVSVLKQSCGDFELLIVDDGSTDRTEKCIRDHSDQRIRYIKHESNLGQNRALNTGIGLAQGELISFLDSDDEWQPFMLERVLEKFRSGEDIGCVYTSYGVRDRAGQLTAPVGNTWEGFVYKEALELGELSPPTTLSVRRSCFDVVGTFELEPVVCQDDVMCLKLAKAFKFGRVSEVLATLHYDAGEQLSDDPVLTAHGYDYLYNKFADDVVKYCGRKTMAKHYAHSGMLFLEARECSMAFEAFRRSLAHGFSARAAGYLLFSLLLSAIQRKDRNEA